jgi:UDP-N-acetylglucosamine 2-epimerase (non-hydrolysing)
MKLTLVAAARPNFMKIAPIIRAIEAKAGEGYELECRLVHTGQHWDRNMSDAFFEELGIPEPHVNLEAGGGTQAEQTAQILVRFEHDLIHHPCDAVLVVGDVTSTMACTLAARKLGIPVMHVEAGIRSGDLRMPEEINRIVTDSICNVYYTTTPQASDNLHRTGVDKDAVVWVGNTMIDTLLSQINHFRKPVLWDETGLTPGNYVVLTLHRPSNVDNPNSLASILEILEKNIADTPVVFPVHPRTRTKLESLPDLPSNLICTQPLSYLEFNYLVKNALAVITDSGGITEETTVMGIPCMTLRDTTERPETCEIGTNELIGTNPENLEPALRRLLSGNWKKGGIPELWDGHAAVRIVDDIVNRYQVPRFI